MIGSASKWFTLKAGMIGMKSDSTFPKKKITLSNIHLAIRREPPFCCRSVPHQCPVVAPNYADCRSCRYGILVSSSVHLASWALWASYISGWCQRIRQGPWALGMHHAVHWDCYRMTLNIKMAKTSHGSIGSSQHCRGCLDNSKVDRWQPISHSLECSSSGWVYHLPKCSQLPVASCPWCTCIPEKGSLRRRKKKRDPKWWFNSS